MEDFLVKTDAFSGFFLEKPPLIDVRSESEFAKGSLPHAINLPILNDAERAEVGICYTKKGAEAAIKLGHELVSGEMKAQRVRGWVAFAERYPDGALFCWRGGQRSQIAQTWLKEAGIDYPRIEGGHKRARQFFLDEIEAVCQKTDLLVLSGRTGSGKTRLLKILPVFVDLERLANHRGSAFGNNLTPQPRTSDFENGLALQFLVYKTEGKGPVVVEDESRLIGKVALPLNFYEKLNASPVVVLKLSMQERIANVLQEYVVDALKTCRSMDPVGGLKWLKEDHLHTIDRITKKLGDKRAREMKRQIENAFETQGSTGDLGGHRVWIERLLCEYYDPMYDYNLEQKRERVVFEGDFEGVKTWLVARSA